mgnify:FL=1
MDRQSYLEINKDAFLNNVKAIQDYVGNKKLMPVIKGNAYGTYINKKLELIKDFDIVAVAIVQEAIELRKLGYKNEIFVLNQPYVEDIPNIIKYNVTIGVASLEFVKELKKYDSEFKIHLELETGMGRTGIYLQDLENFIKEVKNNKKICVEGVYTHFSSADFDVEFTNKQIEKFEKGVEIVKKSFDNLKYIHCSASNGILNFKVDICNLVRPGIILYGYESSEDTMKKINLFPVAKLKSKISFIKEVEPGTSISYSQKFITNKKMKIATVGIGYLDGIKRCLINKGKVVINGKLANMVGTICMDSFMIDVTDIPEAKVGTEVFIWDNNVRKLEDIANECDTINYEIISTISDRVPRKFV